VVAAVGFLAGVGTTLLLIAASILPLPSNVHGDTDAAAAVPPLVIPGLEPPDARPVSKVDRPARIGASPVADLRSRGLRVPVAGVSLEALRSSFDDPRSGGRTHEAMDILAPRRTPVVAVEDGTVAKLFHSEAGGITVYQYDPDRKYAYYYAHLERYAAGLTEGDAVRAGETIGYVGTSGNAPPDTPHLHFAIFRLSTPPRWWDGTPIDPFVVFRSEPLS
jgi:murein DD-endopeptidase MepM/ murein hydrolase activator NlpD